MEKNATRQSIYLILLSGSILCLFLFGYYLFGNSTSLFNDIGGDTKDYIYPIFSSAIRKLKNFDFSFWDFTYGMGADITSNQALLFDPFSIVILLGGCLIGDQAIWPLIVCSMTLRFLVCSVVCYFYLCHYNCAEKSKIISSIAYGFNGYLVLWGQIGFASACFYLIIILLFIEKCFISKTKLPFLSIIVAASMIYSIYLTYMILLFSLFYILIRFFYIYEKNFFSKFFQFILPMGISILIGILLSSFIFLNVASLMFNVSGRLDNSISLIDRIINCTKQLYPLNYFKTTFLRFISHNLQGIGFNYYGYGNYYEAPQFFFSIFLIIFLPQLIYDYIKNGEKKQRILTVIIIVLILFVYFFPVGSMVFNGFVEPFSRHTFLLMPLFSLGILKALENFFIYKKFNWIIFTFTLIIMCIFVFNAIYNIGNYLLNEKVSFIIYIIALSNLISFCVIGMACHFYLKKNLSLFSVFLLFYCILFINLLTEYFPVYHFRDTIKKDSSSLVGITVDSTIASLNYIKQNETDFYRLEKTYKNLSEDGDSLIEDYYGISIYNTLNNRFVSDFLEKFYPQLKTSPNKINFRYSPSDFVVTSMLDVRYVLSKNIWYDDQQKYDLIEQFGDVYVLKNRFETSLGIFYPNIISISDYDNMNIKEQQNSILYNAILENEIVQMYPNLINMNKSTVSNNSMKMDILNIQENNVEIHLNEPLSDYIELIKKGEDPNIVLEVNPEWMQMQEGLVAFEMLAQVEETDSIQVFIDVGEGWSEYYSQRFTVQPRKNNWIRAVIPPETQRVRIDYENNLKSVKLSELQLTNFGNQIIPSQNLAHIDLPNKNNQISGNISTEKEGILCISIPYQKGWKAYIDGAPREIYLTNFGFMGFFLEPGKHNFYLEYTPPYLYEGITISLVGLFTWVAMLALCLKHRNTFKS